MVSMLQMVYSINKRQLSKIFLVLLSSAALFACGPDLDDRNKSKNKGGADSTSTQSSEGYKAKPGTIGNSFTPARPKGVVSELNHTQGDLLVVMDTSEWNGALGDSIRSIFYRDVYGLPQSEPEFRITRIDPSDFEGVFREFYNIFIVGNVNNENKSGKYLRNLLGPNNVKRARNPQPNQPYFINKDVFIKGQTIVYLLATSDSELKSKLSTYRDDLSTYYDRQVQAMLSDFHWYNKFDGTLTDVTKRVMDADFRVPYGYILAKEKKDFLWFRVPDEEVDKNIFMYRVPYVNEDQFSENYLRSLRDSIGYYYVKLEGDSIYMKQQSYGKLRVEEVNLHGKYAVLCRGLWQLTDFTMGGPYVGYAMVSKDGKWLYYVEGFIYAPAKTKREKIRSMRAILSNFDR